MLKNLSPEEEKLVKGMPDEVAIGFLKAHRKTKGGIPDGTVEGMTAFLEEIFKKPQDK